ncbi:alpha/beta fold hydrolase [Vallitalea okinawensis]|uniref:alpha/beta fold hydrolase n=1 Tax=Vallitalea okinawensis TaxID=2078660 RepID=UPI000CFC8F8A|nr:alpha/beta hydrolase [Vallitalea okinawensis]
MRFLEFGNKENKAIILIHGYSISWKMWIPQIDVFSQEYFIIVPILDGHDTENSSTFTTVEKAATDIINYVIQIYGNHIFAVCGASLGATIGIEILAQNRLNIDKAIIDAGPVVPTNKLLLKLIILFRYQQAHGMKKGSKSIDYMLNQTNYPKGMNDEIKKVGGNMSDESCRNVHRSAFRYSIPASLKNVKTEIAYWYGSKEPKFMKKYAKAILRLKPNAHIKVFEGYAHGEMCIGDPEFYIDQATAFFQL